VNQLEQPALCAHAFTKIRVDQPSIVLMCHGCGTFDVQPVPPPAHPPEGSEGWTDYELGKRSPNAAPGECGIRFGYNNGSANALHGQPNIIARCNLDAGHAGDHDRQ
jgi:hypothetical protein